MGKNWVQYHLTKKNIDRLYHWPAAKYVSVLRKIVQIHKEQEITLPNGDYGSNCIICDGYLYPCATLRIIFK